MGCGLFMRLPEKSKKKGEIRSQNRTCVTKEEFVDQAFLFLLSPTFFLSLDFLFSLFYLVFLLYSFYFCILHSTTPS